MVDRISATTASRLNEGTAAPVLRDVREEPVFDLVPLAGRRREVANAHVEPVVSAKRCNCTRQSRERGALLPPPSAVTRTSVANSAVSWSTQTLPHVLGLRFDERRIEHRQRSLRAAIDDISEQPCRVGRLDGGTPRPLLNFG